MSIQSTKYQNIINIKLNKNKLFMWLLKQWQCAKLATHNWVCVIYGLYHAMFWFCWCNYMQTCRDVNIVCILGFQRINLHDYYYVVNYPIYICHIMLIKPCLEWFLSLYTIEINIDAFACRSIASRHLSKSASVCWRYKVDTESLT